MSVLRNSMNFKSIGSFLKKYALVTGGSRGIGREICIQIMASLGYHILINYKGNESSRQLLTQQAMHGKWDVEAAACSKFDVANRE
jgi:3-oxoacyl-[acyl-carrier protein] reductase